MAFRKIIPIHDKETTEDKLILSVGRIIAEKGFAGLTAEEIAVSAGVDRSIVFRTYGGLNGLVAAFGETSHFWPSVEELKAYSEKDVEAMSPGEVMAEFFKAYSKALRKRPQTLEIMARESVERNRYSRILEQVRVRVALEYFEHMQQDPPDEVDLTALVALMAAAVTGLAVHSRTGRFFGGIDLYSDKGWQRIHGALEVLFKKTLD